MKRFLHKEVFLLSIYLAEVLMFCSCDHLTAQTTSYRFDHITTNDGLPNGFVNEILQDRSGFMWFATWEGLVRYDGYNFVSFRSDIRDRTSISSKLVYCVEEDPQGGLWVGTKNGLNFFDKTRGTFQRFVHDPSNSQSLLSDWVIDLVLDQDSNLWVATDQGLTHIRLNNNRLPAQFQHYQSLPKDPQSLPDNQVICLKVDHANRLWAGTMKGLVSIDPSGKLATFPYLEKQSNGNGYSITAIHEDQQHNLWIGTKGGKVYLWMRSAEQFKPIEEISPYEPESNKYISGFCEDAMGNMWISMFDGGLIVMRPDGSFDQFHHHSDNPESLSDNSIKYLYLDRSGIMWIGIKSLGLDKLDLYRKPFQGYRHQSNDPSSLRYNEIMSIAEDPIGRIWVGTHEGFEIFYPEEERFVRYENETGTISPLVTDKIWSLYADTSEKVMWVGGHYGLTKVELTRRGQDGSLEWISEDLSSQFSHILLADPQLDPEKHQVRSIYKDRSGLLWVGTYHGVFALRALKDTVEIVHHFLHDPDNPNSLSDDIVISIFQDSRGDMWFGTRDLGLNLLREEHAQKGLERFIRFIPTGYHDNSISGTEIACIHEDEQGNLWIGTNGEGLNLLKRTQAEDNGKEQIDFFHFGKKEGLLGDAVFGILADKDENLWISTNQGLFKFDADRPNTLPFTQFTTSHGLTSNTFFTGSHCKSRSGKMYFGSQMGLNVFHPDSIWVNSTPPKVVITQLEIFNQAVSVGERRKGRILLPRPISETKEISLSHRDNHFTLEFAALSYGAPENNKYAYQLEGFDEDWIYTDASRRFASYNNLKPGRYVFKVKASNADNIWNEQAAQLIIHTATPPWQSWWAIVLYGLILLSFLYIFRFYTLNKIQLTNDLEIQRRARQKEKEVHQQKVIFFTQLSHEFRTPLTLIIGPVKELVEKGISLSKSEICRHLNLIDFNARHLLRLIDQLLYFSKAEQGHVQTHLESGELFGFICQVCDSFQYMAQKQQVQLLLEADQDCLYLLLDWDKLEKILNNLISNALKFTDPGGEIVLRSSLTTDKTGIILEVIDNGIGIPKDQIDLIFDRFYQTSSQINRSTVGYGIGLALTKKLIELQGGTIQVESQEGVGTRFRIQLPYHAINSGQQSPQEKKEWIDQDLSFLSDRQTLPSAANIKNQDKPLLLVVDDNADIRTFLSHNLRHEYQILEAENGQIALELALIHVPTIIISDVMMPMMDGVQLCSFLKSDERTNHIPIILLTAKSDMEPRIEGIEAGADAYLSKPFHLRHLQVRLEKLIELRAELRKKYQQQLHSQAPEPVTISEDQLFLDKVREIIESHVSDSDFKVGELEHELGMSHMQLYRKLKALTDQSANEFIRSIRLKHASVLLRTTNLNVNEVAYRVGFNSPSYFIKCFRKQFGVLPKMYGKEGKKQMN